MGKITVCIWKSQVRSQFTTATAAARAGESSQGYVGHVALRIDDELGTEYISFWPTNGHKSPGAFSNFVLDFKSESQRFPDVTIEFDHLSTEKLRLNMLYKQYTKYKKQGICDLTWHAGLNLIQDGMSQNCCTTTWGLLKSAGIEEYKPKLKGPTNQKLRELYKCDIGNRAGGNFDGFIWREWMVTPATILHLVASAKENELNNKTMKQVNTSPKDDRIQGIRAKL